MVLALAVVIIAEPVRVGSGSMAPTFHAGDQVLVEKLGRRAHHPHRRDVIAFHVPGSSGLLIKRVVAVAGDSVGLADGVLVVNGRQLHESFVDYNLVDATYFGPVQVPPRTVFVMGDNRSDSVDSRRFGAVPTKDVVGRVVMRIWPPGVRLRHATRIPNPATHSPKSPVYTRSRLLAAPDGRVSSPPATREAHEPQAGRQRPVRRARRRGDR